MQGIEELLDESIDTLASEVLANSRGTNRIVKQLVADRTECTRADALVRERQRLHGLPDDSAQRMRSGAR